MKARALVAAASIGVLAISGPGHAQSPRSAASAVALFDKYCLSEAPEFSRLDRQVGSEKEKHEVVLDRTMPMGKDGQFMHQKNWVIPRRRGKLLLTSADVANGPLHVFGCGLAVIDGDAAELETALSANPRLGKPVKRVAEAAGSAATVAWLARVGDGSPSEDSQVLMAAHMPGIAGVTINLVYRTHLDR
jgi:hypothetical protein